MSAVRYSVRRQRGSRQWCVWDSVTLVEVEGGFFAKDAAQEEADARNHVDRNTPLSR